MKVFFRSKFVSRGVMALLIAIVALSFTMVNSVTSTHAAPHAPLTVPAHGGLDCNGFSQTGQQPFKSTACTDLKGPNGERGQDNGHYVGHDEPAVQFNSQTPGSGNNVQYSLTLPKERPLPATQTFENQVAFWFSMALCDPGSFPQAPCTPNSDTNVPSQAGSAFLEMQFYPPGFAPFISSISCDTTHWCASLHINSLECTAGFAVCNPNCEETTNFAFIQMNGIPTGPAGPDVQTNASFTPNAQTLLMNQGDQLKVTISDIPGNISGGLITRINDLSTGRSGFMVASAANQFQSLNINDCSGTAFSFHPEYSTAKLGNEVPWAALQANVGFSSEIGHFTPGVNGDNDADDAPCFAADATHILAGCLDLATGGDLDFDGSSYQTDWPNGSRHDATSLAFTAPLSAPNGRRAYDDKYPSLQFETDVLASEAACMPTGAGCTVPPAGANFYPYYSVSNNPFINPFFENCTFLFGNNAGIPLTRSFGKDAQYGTPDVARFFGTASSGPKANPCAQQE